MRDDSKRLVWRLALIGLALTGCNRGTWGEFKADQCTSVGMRQHSAVLHDVKFWMKAHAACQGTPAVIAGTRFDGAARCKEVPTLAIPPTQMWGEFDVPDATCSPYWDPHPPKRDDCSGFGLRQYSARIRWEIDPGVSWEEACRRTPIEFDGRRFDGPTRCVEVRALGVPESMWGEFDVEDDSCKPRWDPFKRDGCSAPGKRQYSARLRDTPPVEVMSWQEACERMDATVEGRYFERPTRCVEVRVLGIPESMWGEFDVDDPSC